MLELPVSSDGPLKNYIVIAETHNYYEEHGFLSHQTFDNKLDDEKIKATSIWSLGLLLTGAMKALRGPEVDETAIPGCTWTEITPSPHRSRSTPVPAHVPRRSVSRSLTRFGGCHHSHQPSHSKPGHVPISCCPGG